MNDDFTSIPSGNAEEKSTTSEIHRTVRRARRTVAPFSEKTVSAVTEETKNEIPETYAAVAEAIEVSSAEEITESENFRNLTEETAEETVEELTEGASSANTEKLADEDQTESEETTVEETSEQVVEANEEESAENKKEEELSTVANAFDWIRSFLFSLTAVIFVFTLIFRGVTVNGGSMLPTLESNEYLIISDLFYTPKTGDIVVVQSPHYKNGTEPLIKRIIATGGQTVKINFTTWEVWVDGELLYEDYILRDGATSMNCEDLKPDENGVVELRVEDNCIFVMGDHRNDSLDSRSTSVGQIDERYIMGRVLLRLTPMDRFGKVA